ncbi:MAG: hypothetical protein QOC87_699 [Actinomycetota bacterium]|nr:hypothetical protein [Actinomycetota bacterium]
MQQQRKARDAAKAQALRRARTRMYVLGGTAVLAVIVIVFLVAGGSGSPNKPTPTPLSSASSFGGRLPGLQTGNAVWPPELKFLKQRLQDIGLPALSKEGTVLHIHQHLDIFIGGRKVPVPAGIGIASDNSFIAPLHTHDSTGIMHVESDVRQTFTLGQFFDVWGVRLDAQCIGGYCAGGGRTLTVYVNGSTFSGNPRDVELTSHEEIVLDFGNSSEQPAHIPSSYNFPKGY